MVDREVERGYILDPKETISSDESVFDVLQRKHPSPRPFHRDTLIRRGVMPELENIEVTGSMVHKAAFTIQGGAGPGGCTATHWQDGRPFVVWYM